MPKSKDLESRLQSTEEQLRLFQKISRLMVRELSVQEVLKGIVSLVVEFTRCDSCLVYLLDNGELVLCAANTPHPAAIGKVRLRLDEGLTGWVARERRLLAISREAFKDPRFKNFGELPEDTFEAFLSAPLIARNRVVGVINVQHRFPHQHTGDEMEATHHGGRADGMRAGSGAHGFGRGRSRRNSSSHGAGSDETIGSVTARLSGPFLRCARWRPVRRRWRRSIGRRNICTTRSSPSLTITDLQFPSASHGVAVGVHHRRESAGRRGPGHHRWRRALADRPAKRESRFAVLPERERRLDGHRQRPLEDRRIGKKLDQTAEDRGAPVLRVYFADENNGWAAGAAGRGVGTHDGASDLEALGGRPAATRRSAAHRL